MNSKTILVVDDSSVNNFLLENILQENGYLLDVAFNVKEAFDSISKKKPDLILLDIMMPGIDGYEFLGRLKENPATTDIPVIIVSAKSEIEDKEKATQKGALGYLTKPIEVDTLINKVKSVFV